MDIRQFAYAGIDIYGLLAKSMGKSTAEIQEMVSKGKIGYAEISKALKDASAEGGKFYGAMEKQSQTLNGMISNFQDNIGNLAGSFSTGFSNAIKNVLPSLSDLISDMSHLLEYNERFKAFGETIEGWASKLGGFIDNLTGDQIQTIIDFILAMTKASPIMLGLGAILPKVGQGFSLLSGGVGGAFSTIGSLLNLIPTAGPILSGIVTALGSVGQAVISLVGIFTGLTAIVGVMGYIDEQMGGELQWLIIEFTSKAPEVVQGFINGFVEKLPSLITTGQAMMTNLVNCIEQMIPSFILAVDSILQAISSTMITNGPQIASVLTTGLMKLIDTIIKNQSGFIKGTLEILKGIMKAMRDNLPQLIKTTTESTKEVLETINEFMPSFITLGIEIINALMDGLIASMPTILEMIPLWVESMVQEWVGMIGLWIDVGIQIVKGLWQGIIKNFPTLLAQIPQIFYKIVKAVMDVLGIHSPSTIMANIGNMLIQGLINGVRNMIGSLVSQGRSIASQLVSSFNGMSLWNVGHNLITGLWNGMSSMKSWIVSKARNLASSVLSAVKGLFGVHSPSKEFAWIGEMNIEGLYQGMVGNQGKVQGLIDGMFNLQPNVSPMMTIQRENEDYSSAFTNAINNMQERPVVIDVRADEGIIVQKATQGFREFQRANGRLPF